MQGRGICLADRHSIDPSAPRRGILGELLAQRDCGVDFDRILARVNQGFVTSQGAICLQHTGLGFSRRKR